MKDPSGAASPPLCVTPTEAAKLLSIGRTKMYSLLKSGKIPSIRVGRKILIPTAELEAWLHRASASVHRKDGAAYGP